MPRSKHSYIDYMGLNTIQDALDDSIEIERLTTKLEQMKRERDEAYERAAQLLEVFVDANCTIYAKKVARAIRAMKENLQFYQQAKTECGWLIERDNHGRPEWFVGDNDLKFTFDANKAIRFARAEDAGLFVLQWIRLKVPGFPGDQLKFIEDLKYTEHLW